MIPIVNTCNTMGVFTTTTNGLDQLLYDLSWVINPFKILDWNVRYVFPHQFALPCSMLTQYMFTPHPLGCLRLLFVHVCMIIMSLMVHAMRDWTWLTCALLMRSWKLLLPKLCYNDGRKQMVFGLLLAKISIKPRRPSPRRFAPKCCHG